MGVEAVFSSVVGGGALRARIVELIVDASSKADKHTVDINVMTFSFTDATIADALAAGAQQPRLNVRLIADWSQRATDGYQQVGRLTELGSPNLRVRYKKDQPYILDASDGRIRWSYHAVEGSTHKRYPSSSTVNPGSWSVVAAIGRPKPLVAMRICLLSPIRRLGAEN